MKILVVGSGGVGGYIGANLAKQTEESVTLVARGEHAVVMREKGIGIIEDHETWYTSRFQVASLEALDGVYDLVLVCVKSYDLDAVIDALKGHVDAKSIVIPFGNGIAPYERLKSVCHARVLRGAIYILSHIEGPGYIRKKGKVFAAVVGSDTFLEAVAQVKSVFESANLRIKTPQKIQEAIWKKYIFISAFATLTSYHNASMRAVAKAYKDEALGLLHEIADVAQTQGVSIESEVEKSYTTALSLPESASSSMHLDFQKGRKTELETLSGYIVKKGRAAAIATPLMEKMYHALKSDLYSTLRAQ